MKPIKSFEEAKRRLAELSDSIAELNAFITFADDAAGTDLHERLATGQT